MHPDSTPEIPYGYCKCGCGQKTKIASRNDSVSGIRKGEPRKFIFGHKPTGPANHRYKRVEKVCQTCGAGFSVRPCYAHQKFCSQACAGVALRKVTERYLVEDRGYTTPCWVWQGTGNGGGYGSIKVNNRGVPAHRWMYEQLIGPIPDGLFLDHLCRVRACVNPDHLEPVTMAENSRRGAHVKMTAEKRAEAWRLKGTMTHRQIAERLGVHHQTIYSLFSGRCWSDH